MSAVSLIGAALTTTPVANAAIVSVTGSGTFTNVGDSINGVFDLGKDTVNYTLRLDNISGVSDFGWNGASSFSESSPNPGFTFVADVPSLTNTWTVTFLFSQPITTDWVQAVNPNPVLNHGASQWNLSWVDATSTPVILDPDNQLRDEFTTVGSASFRISDNPGLGTTFDGGNIASDLATYRIVGVAASELQITWSSADTTPVYREILTLAGDSVNVAEAVPEPSTLLGLGIALGLGALSLKRKQKKCTE